MNFWTGGAELSKWPKIATSCSTYWTISNRWFAGSAHQWIPAVSCWTCYKTIWTLSSDSNVLSDLRVRSTVYSYTSMYNIVLYCTLYSYSMLRVFEQICESDCNEAALPLCDGCDRGFHTCCFRPSLAAPPDGEWYCALCVARATASIARFCIVCGDVLDDECAQYELDSNGGAHQISNSRSASASSG